MQNEWKLHLLRGVIDDGNPELHVGDVFVWLVTFWTETVLARSTERVRAAVPLERDYYSISAEIIHISQNSKYPFCILDFGMMAFSQSGSLLGLPLPPECREGDYVAGEIRLELPIWGEPSPYDLRYRWRVNGVVADLANFSLYPGDLGKSDYQDVSGTASVLAGSYILHCSNLGLI